MMITYDSTESFESHSPMIVICMHLFVVGQGVLCSRVAINFGMMMTRGDSTPSTVRIKTPTTTL